MFSIPQDRPVYRVLNPAGFFGPDDHLYPEGAVIVFLDEPNEEFEPMNQMAKDEVDKYLNKLDDFAKEVATKNGRQFASRPRTLDGVIAVASQDARRVSLVPGDGGVPLMQGEKKESKIEKVEFIPVPQTNGKKSGKGTLSLSQTANNQTPMI